MPKNLLIVESPAKAKTIEKYLGNDFKVLSSVGHIRKDVKVDVHDDFNVTYEIDPGHQKVVKELKAAAKTAETVWLATDEDREGESISWHLLEVLKLPKNTNRITFHEITKPALENAIKNPRKIDMNMVASQQARQTLDMLVGYDLSGVVRKKVPGAISAGRVQSPALRLIVEKEQEIEKFKATSSFKVTANFTPTIDQNTNPETPPAFLATLEKHPLPDLDSAKQLLTSLSSATFKVQNIDQTNAAKANPVPFTTATLQIEASSRLGFSASTTMRAAQGLYQAGHITYHRTDSLNLSSTAISAIGNFIKQTYGENYHTSRHFKTKSATAQEAHEAIRPTHIENESVGSNDFERKLYHLIRSRTLATQMANAKIAKTTITITPNTSKELRFLAKGETILFDGFLKVYGSSKETILPPLELNDPVFALQILARETFTKPPARYTEGSLVKKLEELGIGRPSTYAGIMTAIISRGYVIKGDSDGDSRPVTEVKLTPFNREELSHDNLDSLSTQNQPLTAQNQSSTTENQSLTAQNQPLTTETPTLHIYQTTEKYGSTKNKLLPTPVGELVSGFLTQNFTDIVDYNFTASIEQQLDRIAEQKLDRVKMLKDFYTPFAKTVGDSATLNRYNSATLLGVDPKTKKNIYAKIGKNGGFIQLGENEKESGEKPRFMPLPKGKNVKTISLSDALAQLALPSLPRSLGQSSDGTELIAMSGPFGPYLKAGKYNLPLKQADPYTVSLELADELYAAKKASIIADWDDIQIINGAFGPYVKGPGRLNNVKIPKDIDPTTITLEIAKTMLENKPKKSSRHAPHRRTAKAKTTAKTKAKTKATAKTKAKTTTKS